MMEWLQQLVITLITVFGSFVVAWFTARAQLKNETLSYRYKAYSNLLSYLMRISRNLPYRESRKSLDDLLEIEKEIKLCGSRKMIALIDDFYSQVEKSFYRFEKSRNLFNNQIEGEALIASEGSQRWIAGRDDDYGQSDLCDPMSFLVQDAYLDKVAIQMTNEMRWSLGYRELKCWNRIKETKRYQRSNPWE